MKLKKIASLALAGVMAVSMLAGCANDSNSNGDSGNVVVTPATTSIVNAVNKGQSAANDVKIDFTVDSEMDAALEKAVRVYGNDATPAQVWTAINRITGLETYSAEDDGIQQHVDAETGFLTGTRTYFEKNHDGEKMDGKVYTLFVVQKIDDVLTEDAALNMVANGMDDLVAGLAETGVVGNTGSKYFTYSYDGSIGMVSVKAIDGTTDYYVAYVINQTVAVKTL